MVQPSIGVFDSGYGGLSVLRDLAEAMPQYRFTYLGDNARAPYGTRSFDLVYDFTLQATRYLWDYGCPLVVLACNTASAKALRTIQQRYLPSSDDPTRRVLGVIRPTVEHLAEIDTNGHIGIVATPGTIASHSYDIEIAKMCPGYRLTSHACPMWVPLVENGQLDNPGNGLSILDFGVVYKGYTSDTTLTVAKGNLSKTQEELILLVEKAFKKGLELYKKGISIRTAAAKVDEIFAAGKRSMPHGLGHGIGLEIHEFPFVRQRAEPEIEFAPGMIVTLEPGLYDKEAGGVRLENDVLITENGNEVITHSRIIRL